jgi:hypothetical protein
MSVSVVLSPVVPDVAVTAIGSRGSSKLSGDNEMAMLASMSPSFNARLLSMRRSAVNSQIVMPVVRSGLIGLDEPVVAEANGVRHL